MIGQDAWQILLFPHPHPKVQSEYQFIMYKAGDPDCMESASVGPH